MESNPPPAAPPWLLGLARPADLPPAGPPVPHAMPADALGLALSGGGVRSAAFGLGVLQALAAGGWLRRVDYLSTVSGGGFIGAFLGRAFHAHRDTPGAQERVAQELTSPRSEPLRWLRENADYLAPAGAGDALTNAAAFWRNLLALYLVLGLFAFAALGLLAAVGYLPTVADPPRVAADAVRWLAPLVRLAPFPAPPWLVLAEFAVWLAVVPLMIAYWLTAKDLPDAFVAPSLLTTAVLAAGTVPATGSPLPLVVLAAAVVWALAAWGAVRRMIGHADPYSPFRTGLARNHLTGLLSRWVGVTAALVGLAAVDAAGRSFAVVAVEGGLSAAHVGGWLMGLGGAVAVAASGYRLLALFSMTSGVPRWALRVGTSAAVSAAVILAVAGVPLVAVAFAAHLAFELGDEYARGLGLAAGAAALSVVLGRPAAVPFINQAAPLTIYANRLARTFQGAANPNRRLHPDGGDVTRAVLGDDLPWAEYEPHRAGGPLHLVNCTVTQTVSGVPHGGRKDRGGEAVAVGPAGVSVSGTWHATWAGGGGAALVPVADGTGPHPLLARAGGPAAVEPLSLGEWVGVSGAAVSPGRGRRTTVAGSLVRALGNLRLGYWWDTGIAAGDRAGEPARFDPGWRLRTAFAFLFRTQTLLLSEAVGRFAGPWRRFWYLSDGGHVEQTGAFELFRRRVPFVIACDAGEDASGDGRGLAGLVRTAGIEFGAEVTVVPPSDLAAVGVPAAVAPHLARLADLRPPRSAAHAALLLVRYPAPPAGSDGDPFADRRHTWLLYLKATVTGDEPPDVASYAAAHPDFPNETTWDQAFDEAQWESYRELGRHVAAAVVRG